MTPRFVAFVASLALACGGPITVVERPVPPPDPDHDLAALRAEGTLDDPFRSPEQAELSTSARRWPATAEQRPSPASYTHLTLPTIYSV